MFQLYQRLKWAYQKFKVSSSLPFIVLISYTLLGAVIFRNIELHKDEERRALYRNSTEYAFNRVLRRLMEVRCEDTTLQVDPELQTRHAKEALFWFIDYLNLTQVIEERSSATPWTWMGSALYAGQLYTTIGYGYPLVQTSLGQVASIFYIMVGIPIFLIILKEVGRLLSRALRKIYKRWRTAKTKLPDKAVRRMSEPVKAIYNLAGANNGNSGSPKNSAEPTSTSDSDNRVEGDPILADDNPMEDALAVGKEEEKSKENGSGSFPIPLALGLLVIWINLSAALFCVWETKWTFLTSVYFFFVSISTVGLGDIVPSKPDMMLVNFVLILIGLALLSMCINLIQEAIERIIEQLLQEYIEEIEKMATIVTADNEFVEETATPFEVGMSADLLTAPLTALSTTQDSWLKRFPRQAKDWMAEKLVDKLLVRQLDGGASDSESEEEGEPEELGEVVVANGRQQTPEHAPSQIDVVSRNSRKLKRKFFRKRGNFILNYNLSTLHTIQAMEKVKLKTKNDGSFRGRLFAKFATNDRFTRFLDDHVMDHPHPALSIVGTVHGEAVPQLDLESLSSWRCKLVEPESTANSVKNGSVSTTSTYDLDSLCSLAYHDVSFGYSTESVLKLIAQEKKQKEEELRRSRQRRTLPAILSVPEPPPLAVVDEPPAIKIEVARSSESPEPQWAYALDPHEHRHPLTRVVRRSSTPVPCLTTLSPEGHGRGEGRSRMPMMRCPSCMHMSTAPAARTDVATASACASADVQSMRRVRELCGLLPSDFVSSSSTAHKSGELEDLGHHHHHHDDGYAAPRSPSPCHSSHLEDSGYDNSMATDKCSSVMTDSALLGSSLTTSLVVRGGEVQNGFR